MAAPHIPMDIIISIMKYAGCPGLYLCKKYVFRLPKGDSGIRDEYTKIFPNFWASSFGTACVAASRGISKYIIARTVVMYGYTNTYAMLLKAGCRYYNFDNRSIDILKCYLANYREKYRVGSLISLNGWGQYIFNEVHWENVMYELSIDLTTRAVPIEHTMSAVPSSYLVRYMPANREICAIEKTILGSLIKKIEEHNLMMWLLCNNIFYTDYIDDNV